MSIFSLAIFLSQIALPQNKATYAGDDKRTGWYKDQALLDPDTVAGSGFGKLFDTAINGQVYAQPLVSNGVLFVATETNWIYGLDPLTGATKWSRNIAPPWNVVDVGCGDLTPTMGITGTPVIDTDSGTAYFISKTYLHGTTGLQACLCMRSTFNLAPNATDFRFSLPDKLRTIRQVPSILLVLTTALRFF